MSMTVRELIQALLLNTDLDNRATVELKYKDKNGWHYTSGIVQYVTRFEDDSVRDALIECVKEGDFE